MINLQNKNFVDNHQTLKKNVTTVQNVIKLKKIRLLRVIYSVFLNTI